ncbi:MAG: NifU N-terminal domain-containing protein [Candidatus Obscuribacterales bacterium]|nr:NifU N-terminal domain-containing protein [Candidatus Obscuribacterales bacterium]
MKQARQLPTRKKTSKQACPAPIARLLDIDGIESIFFCGDLITINKHPALDWKPIVTAAKALFSNPDPIATENTP